MSFTYGRQAPISVTTGESIWQVILPSSSLKSITTVLISVPAALSKIFWNASGLPDIGPDVADDPAWAAAARASLAHTDARLDKRFDQDDGMDRILALRARAVDHLLKDA